MRTARFVHRRDRGTDRLRQAARLHTLVPSAVRPRAGEATYHLIQEPDEGYGQVIGVIDQA
jgi:hypothetical protein